MTAAAARTTLINSSSRCAKTNMYITTATSSSSNMLTFSRKEPLDGSSHGHHVPSSFRAGSSLEAATRGADRDASEMVVSSFAKGEKQQHSSKGDKDSSGSGGGRHHRHHHHHRHRHRRDRGEDEDRGKESRHR
jgi:hypothetical protein